MDYKKLLFALEFNPKENSVGVFSKKYADGYVIEVDFEKEHINYGEKIQSENKVIQNFSQPENFVVLECVNRLLEKSYQPENIILEKTYPTGRGTSGRLDILILKDEQSYLMIECKTYGEEFDKELKNTRKNGGQLFTYFQQDTKAELLMLYSSNLIGDDIIFENKIIKIEEEFRQAGNVKNTFKLWDKKFHEKGFWENPLYGFQPEKFTKGDLRELTEEKGKKLFHDFATILRKHSVSDKPNAFNVIFNLFLAKLYDEQKRDDVELEFQWKKDDNPVDFQVRLYNLHKEGLNDFLRKEIDGIYDKDFDAKTSEDLRNAKKKFLKFNKLFDIKSVIDDDDFEQNHRVLRKVVQLIEKYQIRYPRKQKYLSEFFELLLTTGLKQEVGQYFTPPPIAKFIVKSLPLHQMIEQEVNKAEPKLPAVIDFAVGSGHFVTEIMEEYQDIINKDIDAKKVKYSSAENEIISWQVNPYSWASKYVYGIEKDYRLVKVAKVGCYFYGDGLAQIIHGDGLDSLTNPPKSYVGLLEQNTNTEDSTKNKFSVVVANPPYAVDNCKDDLEYIGSEKDFSLYKYLTYDSSEIECLFVERTKQLLKDGGVAGIILPSSILNKSNSEIYIKTREILLRNFEIIAIAEFGNKTFMATNTSTVVLFLRRRNNLDSINLKIFIEKFFVDFQDNNPPKPFNTIDLERPFTKYVNHVWKSVNLADYISWIIDTPNENIQKHEFYKTYRKSVETKIEVEIAKAQKNRKTQLSEEDIQKIRDRVETEYFSNFVDTEKEKLLYFILAYHQKTIVINSGNGIDEEKRFLGYYFSNTRGKEGLYPTNGRSTIEECTKLFDEKETENPLKTSTYIYNAFRGKYIQINDSLKNNIAYGKLVDMLTFDRSNFDKSISLNVKKKVKIDTKWNEEKFEEIADIIRGVTYSKSDQTTEKTENIVLTADNITLDGCFNVKKEIFLYDNFVAPEEKQLKKNDIFMCFSSGSKEHLGKVAFIENDTNYLAGGFMGIIRAKENTLPKYLFSLLNSLLRQSIRDLGTGSNINNLSSVINAIKIPLPPLDIQQKIVSEIEVLEKKEAEAKEKVEGLRKNIDNILATKSKEQYKIGDILTLEYGAALPESNRIQGEYPVMGSNGIVGYHNEFLVESPAIIVGRKGSAGKVTWIDKNCFPIDTTFYVKLINIQFDLKLVYYTLQKLNLESLSVGTGVPGLNRNDAYSKTIPLPPLSEQQKIVSEIEKIEAQIAELEQQLTEIPKEKEAILKKHL